jgi:hypothetical protein
MPEEKTFYVGVGNKSEIRRDLLECSKSVVGLLKNYDKLNSVRQEKIEQILNLKNIMSEIKQLSIVLKDKFPSQASSVKIAPKKRVVVKEKIIVPKTVVKTVYKKPDNEIKKLEEELSEIEERLNRMGA